MIDLPRQQAVPGEPNTGEAANDIAVHIADLTKTFGAVRAVDHLTLDIRRGETVALLGPNGAGKTTTVSMLLGLLPPDSGSVSILGRPPAEAIQSGRIGAMLQEGNLMPGVRIGELLDYVVSLRSPSIPRQRLVAIAQLGGLERRRVDRLSGGQLQRVRFALAIASEPDVLVLDEPTAAMDVEARREFWASMHDYASSGRTVLFATHYLEEAEAFASRVVIIASGRIVADGTVADLRRRGETQTLQFTTPKPAANHRLEHLAGVRHVESRGDLVTLETTHSDATVRDLVASDIPWSDLEVRGARLEDVFLSLVANATNNGHGKNGGAR